MIMIMIIILMMMLMLMLMTMTMTMTMIIIIIIIWTGCFRYCNECKEDTIHHVWSTIVEEPQLLIIQLKRFNNSGKKLKRKMKVTK